VGGWGGRTFPTSVCLPPITPETIDVPASPGDSPQLAAPAIIPGTHFFYCFAVVEAVISTVAMITVGVDAGGAGEHSEQRGGDLLLPLFPLPLDVVIPCAAFM